MGVKFLNQSEVSLSSWQQNAPSLLLFKSRPSVFQRLKSILWQPEHHRGRGGLEPKELKISNREMNRGFDWQGKEEGGRWGSQEDCEEQTLCSRVWEGREGCTFDRKYY